MTAVAPNPTSRKRSPQVGERHELARYTLPDGTVRQIAGQRVNGSVRLIDVPLGGRGRGYVIERELEKDGYDALLALANDYHAQATKHGRIPAAGTPVERYLAHLELDNPDR
jgi:hypothetical protein